MISEIELSKLKKKSRFLDVVNVFAQELLKAKSIDQIVWTVAKQAISKLGYEDCIVYLLNKKGDTLIQKAAFGPKNTNAYDINNPIKLKIGEGICGSVAKSGIAEIIPNTSKDLRYKIDDAKRLSEIAVPIILEGKVIGIIDSEHTEEGFFNLDDLEILTTIASMVSVKIEQAITHENLEILVDEKTKKLSQTLHNLQNSYKEISSKNRENETLLKEIHHRVKNNLQIISSLLNLQSNQTESTYIKEVFTDAKNRIQSMSAIHEQLYQKGHLSELNTSQYISDIVNDLINSYNINSRIKVTFDIPDISLDLERSVPLGLILNEIISNALKHAFPENNPGNIKISIVKSEEFYCLQIHDDGIGFDTNKETNSLGLELINTLVFQIDGKLEIKSNAKGTIVQVTFKS